MVEQLRVCDVKEDQMIFNKQKMETNSSLRSELLATPKGSIQSLLREIPIEIHFEIFQMMTSSELIKTSLINQMYCCLVAKFLLTNETFRRMEQCNNDVGVQIPYMFNGEHVPKRLGPNLFSKMLESIANDKFDDGIETLNLWIDHRALDEKSKPFLKTLVEKRMNDAVKRLYMNCGSNYLSEDNIDTCTYWNNMGSLFNQVQEIYLNGFTPKRSNDLNTLLVQCVQLRKLFVKFSISVGASLNGVVTLNQLEAPKYIRENLTHLALRNVSYGSNKLFEVIDIFETFQELVYFEYDEIDLSDGISPLIKFTDYDNVIEKLERTKLETLIYRPSNAHQRFLGLVSERQAIIEEIEDQHNDEGFPHLLKHLRNLELSDYDLERESKYDGFSALIFQVMPLIVQSRHGLALERVILPSETLLNKLKTQNSIVEIQLGCSPPLQSSIPGSFMRPNKYPCMPFLSQKFTKLTKLFLDGMNGLENSILTKAVLFCPSLREIYLTKCTLIPVQSFDNFIDTSQQFELEVICVKDCSNIGTLELCALFIQNSKSLVKAIVKQSTTYHTAPKPLHQIVEMEKLSHLCMDNSCQLLKVLSGMCRFTSLVNIECCGSTEEGLVQLIENNPNLKSVEFYQAKIESDELFKCLAEHNIQLKTLIVDSEFDLSYLRILTPQVTCQLSIFKNRSKIPKSNMADIIYFIKSCPSLSNISLGFSTGLPTLEFFQTLHNSCHNLHSITLSSIGELENVSQKNIEEFIMSQPRLTLVHLMITAKASPTVLSCKDLEKLYAQRYQRTPKIILSQPLTEPHRKASDTCMVM